jgi:hypothetical protein
MSSTSVSCHSIYLNSESKVIASQVSIKVKVIYPLWANTLEIVQGKFREISCSKGSKLEGQKKVCEREELQRDKIESPMKIWSRIGP